MNKPKKTNNKAAQAKTVTVCSACLRACCWQGIYLCDGSMTAGTVKKTVKELTELDLEHPGYWDL
jgi:hypothetical protein